MPIKNPEEFMDFVIDTNPDKQDGTENTEKESKVLKHKKKSKKPKYVKYFSSLKVDHFSNKAELDKKERDLTSTLFGEAAIEDKDEGIVDTGEDEPINRAAAWSDDDDEEVDTEAPIKKTKLSEINFKSVYGQQPKWAKVPNESEEEDEKSDDEDIERKASKFLNSKNTVPEGYLKLFFKYKVEGTNMSRKILHSLPTAAKKTTIQAIDFCKEFKLMVIAGFAINSRDGIAHLVKFEKESAYVVRTWNFPRAPLSFARFVPKGEQIVLASPGKAQFFIIKLNDLKSRQCSIRTEEVEIVDVTPDGRYVACAEGLTLRLFYIDSLEQAGLLGISSTITAVAFSPQSKLAYVLGENGQVFIFSLDTFDCVHAFYDEGSIKGTALATSPDGRFLACGSSSGIVNLYETAALQPDKCDPKPAKAFSNLVTSVTLLQFSPASDMLLMASAEAENGCKIVRLASFTVFRNVPKDLDIRRVFEAKFSPTGLDLAIMDENNTIKIFGLKDKMSQHFNRLKKDQNREKKRTKKFDRNSSIIKIINNII